MPNNLRIIRLRRDDSCYEFEVQNQVNSRKTRAFLTYELCPAQKFERTLLLCEDPYFFMALELAPNEKLAITTLATLLTKAPKNFKLGTTKQIVNQLVDREYSLDCIRVAVHTFGPVPVVVTSDEVQLRVHGRTVKANLAFFPKPNTTGVGNSYGFPCFISTKSEFRKCMSVSPHLVFRRYFEDVAEDFHDLRRTLRQVDFYRRAKGIEKTLAASVGSKLQSFIPKIPLTKAGNPEQKEAWDYFISHAELLYEMAIARNWAIFLLNEVYQTMGVYSLSQEYKNRIIEYHNRFASLLGDKKANELRTKSRLLQFLDECHETYHSVDLFQTGVIVVQKLLSLAKDAPGPWEKEFTKFAAFALLVRTIQGSSKFVKLFISYHHEVATSEIIRVQVKNFIEQISKGRIAVLSIKDLPPGSPFPHVIRASIWLANGTIALCPSDTRTISSLRDKDYKWVARESEYSILLKKPVLFGTQDGSDRMLILDDLRNPNIEYLVSGSKLPSNEERADNLVEHFSGLVNAPFQVHTMNTSSDSLDPRLKESVSTFMDRQSLEALQTLFDGYFNQFEIEAQRALVITLARLGHRGRQSKKWIVQEFVEHWKINNIDNSLAAFAKMWKQVKDRKLNIGKNGLALLEHPLYASMNVKDRNCYHERLGLALRILRPEMSLRERKSWRATWLNRQAVRLNLDLKCLWG
jgi:hypothetical protein